MVQQNARVDARVGADVSAADGRALEPLAGDRDDRALHHRGVLRDGLLDLFVCNYVRWSADADVFCSLDGRNKSYCTPEAYRGTTPWLFRNNGNGTFTAGSSFVAAVDSVSLAIADFNGDGRLDLAATQVGGVSVLLGNGDGTFGPHAEFGIPGRLAVSDFNVDGRQDLAVVSTFPSSISIMLGNGDGTFGAPTTTGTVRSPRSLAISDLNGDGKPDAAVTDEFEQLLSVHLGNGDGTFTAAPREFGTGNAIALAVADFNRDNAVDLLWQDEATGTLVAWLMEGTQLLRAVLLNPSQTDNPSWRVVGPK